METRQYAGLGLAGGDDERILLHCPETDQALDAVERSGRRVISDRILRLLDKQRGPLEIAGRALDIPGPAGTNDAVGADQGQEVTVVKPRLAIKLRKTRRQD